MAVATPQRPASARETLIRDYEEIKPNKGRAVQLVDGVYFRSAEHEDYAVVQACRRSLSGGSCARGVYLMRKSAAHPKDAAACYGRA